MDDVNLRSLGENCLFQDLSVNSQGHSLVFVFGSLRKTQTPKANGHISIMAFQLPFRPLGDLFT